MKVASSILFGIFLFVTLFGLPMLLSHTDHHLGCPLQGAAEVMCESTIIEHFAIWGSMFASLLVSVLLAAGVVIFYAPMPVLAPVRIRYRHRLPQRPTLFQQLYSDGILNRKEPAFS